MFPPVALGLPEAFHFRMRDWAAAAVHNLISGMGSDNGANAIPTVSRNIAR